MINEEGGIDPEQFRMEAMFDRMDAIGKGVLGLTIQCAQCHNHKFDPLTQEEYYRLFAFLNNDHEAQRRRLHARRADEARPSISAQIREIEDELQHTHPDWAERMARVGGRRSAADQPEWTVVQPTSTTSRPAARSTCRSRTARSWRQGYAPTKHTVKLTGEGRRCRRSPPSASSC